MRLIDAYNLLVEDGITDNHRYFAEVYKGFQFTDEQSLKEYLEFILHEPVHWMRGFPAKLLSKTSFSKPKTAVIKLLKKKEVEKDIGDELAEKVYNAVWTTYKKEHEGILQERESRKKANTGVRLSVIEQFDTESFESLPVPPLRDRSGATAIMSGVSGEELADEISVASSFEEHDVANEGVFTNSSADQKRIRLLKSALFKLSETLPAGARDAFHVLVEAV
jgi:hypothetical protein